MIDLRKMLLFNGQIISTKTNKTESEFIKFEQLNIDLSDLVTTTIKSPKLQETNTFKLLGCFFSDIGQIWKYARKILIKRFLIYSNKKVSYAILYTCDNTYLFISFI